MHYFVTTKGPEAPAAAVAAAAVSAQQKVRFFHHRLASNGLAAMKMKIIAGSIRAVSRQLGTRQDHSVTEKAMTVNGLPASRTAVRAQTQTFLA